MERPSASVNQPTPRIDRSTIPSIPVTDGSVYTLLFQPDSPVKTQNFYTYPTDRPAFIDAATGDSNSWGELKELTLKLGYGLRNHVILPSVPWWCKPPRPIERRRRHDIRSRFAVLASYVIWVSPHSLAPISISSSTDPHSSAVAARLKITLASSTSTALELSLQWIDGRACMLIVAPSHLSIAIEMFTSVLKVPEAEASLRIWVIDMLRDYKHAIRSDTIDEYNSVGRLLGFGRLESGA